MLSVLYSPVLMLIQKQFVKMLLICKFKIAKKSTVLPVPTSLVSVIMFSSVVSSEAAICKHSELGVFIIA